MVSPSRGHRGSAMTLSTGFGVSWTEHMLAGRGGLTFEGLIQGRIQ